MKSTFRHYFIAVITAMLIIPVSCVDLDFDEPPPGGEDPNLPVNITIAKLKSRHTLEQFEEITDDVTFSGFVISNDAAGNFFKQLVIQDATGGIEMRIDMNDLNNLYPVGRKVYVKAKGLWLGDYNGLVQLGAGEGTDDQGDPELIRIPESLIDQHIVPATFGNDVTPKTLTIDDLTFNTQDSLVSTLVRFEGMQFVAGDAGQTYADTVLQESLNREIEDCAKSRLIVRTSGYASFAGDTTPLLNGTIVGVLSIFGDVYQLTIRDLDDVVMEDELCGGGSGGGDEFEIGEIRQLFASGSTTAPAGTVQGVVISDYASMSVTGRNLYIQDASGGIVVRFVQNHTFAIGSEIKITIGGGALSEFNGLLQIDGINTSAATVVGTPGDVTPRIATVSEVLSNLENWESTLVSIPNVTLSGNTVYNGEVTVNDGTGTIIMFTRSAALFAQDAIPGGTVILTGIVSEFDVPQLIIRTTSDVDL